MSSLLNQLKKNNEEEQRILKKKLPDVDKSQYTNQQNFIIESAKFLKDNRLIITRKHPRYISFPSHKHDYIELNYVYSGTLTQTIEHETVTLKKGELLFLNQHIEHSLEKCEEDDIIINFIIQPSFFDYILHGIDKEASSDSITSFLFESLYNQDKNGSYMYFKVSQVDTIQSLIKQIIEDMMSQNILSELKIKFSMGLLFVELMNHTDSLVSKKVDYDYKLIKEVLQYISTYFSNASLQALSESMNIQPYNLSKFIKKTFNRSFKTLVQEKRIEEAKKLLKHDTITVEDIALSVGYENLSYFYRLFKQSVGLTPNDYRKSQK